MQRLFHYTVGARVKGLLETGRVELPEMPKLAGKPSVWFTSSESWEQMANRVIVKGNTLFALDQKQTELWGRGLWRVLVDPARVPLSFRDWARRSAVAPSRANALKRAATAAGSSVEHWRVSFEPVPWMFIEVFDNGQWRAPTDADFDALPACSAPKPQRRRRSLRRAGCEAKKPSAVALECRG
jgi:hypothetical protein